MKALLSFEMVFILFLTSGLYKGTVLGEWLPIDATVLFGGLTFLSGLVIVAREGGWPRRSVAAGLVALLLFAWTGTTLVWTPAQSVGLDRVLLGLPLVALAFAGSLGVVARDEERVTRFLRLFAGFGLIPALITFMVAFNASGGWVTADQTNYIPRGIALAVATVVLLVDAFAAGRRLALRVGAVAMASIYCIAVLLAGSRQALLGLVLVVPFLAWFGWKAVAGYRVRALLLSGLMVAGLVWAGTRIGVSFSTLERLQQVLSGQLGTSLEARAQHLRAAFGGFEDSPVIGHGVGSFGRIHGLIPTDHPHNVVAEVLFEEGIVGFGLLVLLAAVCFVPLLLARHRLRTLCAVGLPLVLVVLTVNALVSSTFTENRLLFGFLGLSAVTPARRAAAS